MTITANHSGIRDEERPEARLKTKTQDQRDEQRGTGERGARTVKKGRRRPADEAYIASQTPGLAAETEVKGILRRFSPCRWCRSTSPLSKFEEERALFRPRREMSGMEMAER